MSCLFTILNLCLSPPPPFDHTRTPYVSSSSTNAATSLQSLQRDLTRGRAVGERERDDAIDARETAVAAREERVSAESAQVCARVCMCMRLRAGCGCGLGLGVAWGWLDRCDRTQRDINAVMRIVQSSETRHSFVSAAQKYLKRNSRSSIRRYIYSFFSKKNFKTIYGTRLLVTN